MKPSKLNPTYKVSFWGVRCYLDDDTGYLWGINKFHDYLIPVATWFHNFMSLIALSLFPAWEQPGFMFKVLEVYKETEGNANAD